MSTSKKSEKLNEEHIKRILFKSNYIINEAKYSIVDNIEDDDIIPKEIWSTAPLEEDEEESPMEEPTPEEESPMEEPTPEEEPPMEEPTPEEEPPMENQKSVDNIQSDILKSSVMAMKKMNDQLNNLESTLSMVNTKIDLYKKDVEEVKEPTNIEKLSARKEDSHPFYLNLNDMWKGNSFQARREIDNSQGIRKLEDGTYIADFDTLPKYSEQEIRNSF